MNLKEQFGDWYELLEEFILSDAFRKIGVQVRNDRTNNPVIPSKSTDLLFKVFRVTPYKSLKVIVLGQDPYHGLGQYDGLAFSNSTLDKPQPSLRNILKEVEDDAYDGFALTRVADYSLYNWAEQGVLLINTALTVRAGQPGTHMHIWKPFTSFLIGKLQEKNDLVWLLWGNHAANYKELITNTTHAKIISGHPSPLNTTNPFIGSKPFSRCNEELRARNLEEIIW